MRQLKITKQITDRDTDSLEKYLNEISKVALINSEEEARLAKQIKAGSHEALATLTKANLRFVVSVSKQYQNQGLALSDLINEGNIGLIKAAMRFDESRGFKFISYAVWWIRQSIMQAIIENSRMIRLPLNKIGSYSKVNKMMMKFEQEFEREPSVEELADLMETSPRDIKELMKGMTRHISIDSPLNENDDSTMADTFQSEEEEALEDTMQKENLRNEIIKILKSINNRDAAILSCYFGVNGEEVMNVEEISSRFNLTKERVRQIKEKAIRRLRQVSTVRDLRDFLN